MEWWRHFPCRVPRLCTVAVCLWNKEALVCISVCLPPAGQMTSIYLSHCCLFFGSKQRDSLWGVDSEVLREETRTERFLKQEHDEKTEVGRAEENYQGQVEGEGGEKDKNRQSEWALCDQKTCLFSWHLNSSGATLGLSQLSRSRPHRLPDIQATGPESERSWTGSWTKQAA